MKRSTVWLARVVTGAVLVILLSASFVLFQYTTAVSLEGVYPQDSASLKEGKVTILAGLPGLDPGKGEVRVLVDGELVPPGDIELVPSGGVRITRVLADGLHRVELDIRTRNIFARHMTYAWSFSVDTKAPLVSDVRPPAEAALSQRSSRFSATFDEVVESRLMVDGREMLKGTTTDLEGMLELSEGRHELRVEAQDNAGNVTIEEWTVLVDTSAPTFSLEVNPEGTWNNTRNHLHLEVSDALSPTVDVVASADGKPLEVVAAEALTKAASAGINTWSFEIDTSVLGEGQHSFALSIKDEAGNAAELNSSFDIDLRKIRIDLSERRLYHYQVGAAVKEYPVAVGLPQYPTPRGTFEIVVREKNPTWNPPPSPWAEGLEPVPPGPGNPLGTRWIGLSAYAIGIHGTYDRNSIGRAASHGCIRMYIEDVEELFEQVEVGMPVEIVR